MKLFVASLILIFAFGILVISAAAQEGGPTPSPDEVNAIASNLYCPVCANVPLDACGTAACAQWRQQIADMLTQGDSAKQIYDYFVQQYGPSVLATPPASGFNWLIYLLPPLAFLLAAVVFSRGLVRSKRPQAQAKRKAKTRADKYSRLLEKQLKARR